MSTKAEHFRKIYRLVEIIKELDELIFENCAVEEIALIKDYPKDGESFVGYLSKEDSLDGKDRYTILAYFNEALGEVITTKRVPIDRVDERGEVPIPFTEEELFIRIAAHEVRHRVQHLFQINLFTPTDLRNAKDPYLRRLLRIFTRFYELSPPKCLSEKREFDALVIEAYSGKIWLETKDILKVAKIVKEDARILLRKYKIGEDTSPFFCLFYMCSELFLCRFLLFLFAFSIMEQLANYRTIMLMCSCGSISMMICYLYTCIS